jgi:hypothetical protein
MSAGEGVMVAWGRWVGRVRRAERRPDVDPFSTLEVQLALARLDREIAELLDDPGAANRFAQGHHLRAAQLAYEQLLQEACQLAEVNTLPGGGVVRRVIAEAELRARGWTW